MTVNDFSQLSAESGEDRLAQFIPCEGDQDNLLVVYGTNGTSVTIRGELSDCKILG